MSGEDDTRRRGWFMLALGWALAFFMVTAFYRVVLQERHNPNRLSVVSEMDGELLLEKNQDGHYLVEGTINGARTTFLVDTGATRIAMSEDVATAAGLAKGAPAAVQTAAGVTDVWTTRIDEVQIGFIIFKNLSGVIVPEYEADTVLLGMNALGQLNITHDTRGVLRLSPPASAKRDWREKDA